MGGAVSNPVSQKQYKKKSSFTQQNIKQFYCISVPPSNGLGLPSQDSTSAPEKESWHSPPNRFPILKCVVWNLSFHFCFKKHGLLYTRNTYQRQPTWDGVACPLPNSGWVNDAQGPPPPPHQPAGVYSCAEGAAPW